MKRMTLAVTAAVATCLASPAVGQDDVLTPAGKSYTVGVDLDDLPLVFEPAEAGAMSGAGQLGEDGGRNSAPVAWEREGSAITLTFERGGDLGDRQTRCDPWPDIPVGEGVLARCVMDGFLSQVEIESAAPMPYVTRTQ
ncbi:MAG: hypothetical protein CMH91_00555 [Oceanicaulis sp.]|uniref:hypothetical protein n=2 Tax=unclassified Oceanicaulis TaxID=2632123 RepID=UPI000C58610F|nr:hypothetical protein [Oceanicaulis sp.]MBC37538.1 hypothetical protein [Oceanicaulis sp.]MBG37189.1 hypothetical protein [Oceanicaulis sp.]HBU61324.1 hypothetical protein [Oceanicaulis sp.]|tara:strand:- start:447 stop:863 length:417 start_codon:yes stop_codon:yes gene_type:complete